LVVVHSLILIDPSFYPSLYPIFSSLVFFLEEKKKRSPHPYLKKGFQKRKNNTKNQIFDHNPNITNPQLISITKIIKKLK